MSTPDPEIEAVLVQRLADVGHAAAGGLGAASGAAAGARWSARRLRTETAASRIDLGGADPEAVAARLAAALAAAPERDEESGRVVVRGVVGSGFGGLNPAYVLAGIDSAGGVVSIATYAKEGLIKQHTAEKALQRLREEIAL